MYFQQAVHTTGTQDIFPGIMILVKVYLFLHIMADRPVHKVRTGPKKKIAWLA